MHGRVQRNRRGVGAPLARRCLAATYLRKDHMSNYTDTADAIRRQVKTYEAFKFAAEVLDRFGSLEQAEKESQGRVDQMQAKEAAARQSLTEVQGVLDAANAKATDIVRAAEETAAQLVNEARAIQGAAEVTRA